MFLLEYRSKEIPLASGSDTFTIPENVYLIGTMNTIGKFRYGKMPKQSNRYL